MNILPEELESHLAGDVTNHCFCWIIRRSDSVVHGFTDHDRTLPVENVSCEPQTGMSASEATSQLGLAVDSLEVEGALSSLAISEMDIERGAFDGARVETWLVNWQSPEQRVLLRRSLIGKISRSGGQFVAELKSSAAALDAVKGRRVMRACDAQLGDARCGFDAGQPGFRAEGAVTGIAARMDIRVSGLVGYEQGWFDRGRLVWSSGANSGKAFTIARHEDDRLVLHMPPPLEIRIGDGFILSAGCDKSFAQCKAKFGNGVNFRGFPHLPGNDAAYQYADGKSVFDGGALVP
ncbi:MAG: DUF2163 domain-containing protein [Phyllobacterium sp.]